MKKIEILSPMPIAEAAAACENDYEEGLVCLHQFKDGTIFVLAWVGGGEVGVLQGSAVSEEDLKDAEHCLEYNGKFYYEFPDCTIGVAKWNDAEALEWLDKRIKAAVAYAEA